MGISLAGIHWPAVVAAAFVYSAFCGIWHRQFAFGRKWEEAMGFERPLDWKETAIYFVIPSIGCLVTSTAVAVLINLLNITSLSGALIFGLSTGIGFAMAVTFTNAVIPIMKKPLVFGAITGAAHAIGITLATVLIYTISR
jgi:Protein of unknown function (DUF1761)